MTNPNFTATLSTNDLYYDLDTSVCLTDMLDGYDSDIADLEADVAALEAAVEGGSGGGDYAAADHTHDEYALVADVTALQDAVASKADASHAHTEYAATSHDHDEDYASINHTHSGYAATNHTHTGYASTNHTHSNYITTSDYQNAVANMEYALSLKADTDHTHTSYASTADVTALQDAMSSKADATHTHTEYAASSHSHDDYATVSALDTLEAEVDGKASASHTHTEYASSSHVHDDYATTTALSELSATVSGKANSSHSHDDRYYTESEIDSKLAAKSDASHTHAGVYDAAGAAASALTSANAYTDAEIANLLNNSTTAVDSIMELAEAMEDNADAITALEAVAASKASASDLTSHTGNTTVHVTATERSNWNAAKAHADSAHAPANAEANQNAFSNVAIGDVTIAADSKTDTLNLIAGNNVTLTPNADNDGITIAATNTVYNHPTSAGNRHIPAGGSSGQILRWSADGTAVWGADNNTTYSAATQSAAGLMSASDKAKLDGIAANANNYTYTLPSAGTNLGGVKSGGDVSISGGLITVNDDSHNHVISNIDGLQTALDGKAVSGHNHDDVYYTESEIDEIVSGINTSISGKAASSHTHTIANVTNLQSSLDAKVPTSRTINGKALTANITLSASDVGADVSGTAATQAAAALQSAKDYADDQIEALGDTYYTETEIDSMVSTINSAVSGKADASHTHTVDTALSGTSTNPVQNKVINSALAGKANTSHGNHVPATQTANNAVFLRNDNSWQTVTPANIGAYTKSEIDSKISTLNTAINGKAASSHSHDDRYYTESEIDAKFDAIIGEGASTTLDTIGEISSAIEDNQDMLETLNSAIGTKANASDLTSHTGNKSNPHSVTASQVGAYTKAEVDSKLSGKADSGHTHTIDSSLSSTSTNPVQNKVVKSALDGKANTSHGNHVPATQTADNTKFLRNDNTWQSVTPSNIGAYTKAEIDSKVSTLNTAINGKAASNHTHSAYVNQNAFSNVKVGTTTVVADSTTDTLELAGSNVTITPDATNDKVTIGITKANVTSALGYTPPTTNTTYNAATASAAGLMSAADKSKLDGIASGANAYTLPAAGASLGGVKSGGDVTISSGTITVNDDSHNHVISNVDGLQSALDGKAASSHTHSYAGSSSAGGAATSANKLATARTISLTGDVTGSTSFDGSGNVSITATIADDSHNHTIANIDGLQSALNAKAASDHKHYAQEVTVAGEDLDNYTDAGIYVFAQAYAPTNVPAGTNGWLVVIPWGEGGGTIKQLWFRHGTSGTNDHETYVRTKISNVSTWSPWSKYYTTSNPPTAAEVGATPAFTNSIGGVEYSFNTSDGKNVLDEIASMPQGLHTIYSQGGVSGNPKTTESWRLLVHKTSATIGWVVAFGSSGSVYANYQNEADHFQGWKCVYEATNKMILWSGASYLTSTNGTPQVVTPSKKLSECRTGWLLLWSDYDASTSTANDTDFCTTYIPKYTPTGGTWGGKAFYCSVPTYVGGDASDVSTEIRVIKPVYVHDDCLKGSYQNTSGGRNDVVLRAVYEV